MSQGLHLPYIDSKPEYAPSWEYKLGMQHDSLPDCGSCETLRSYFNEKIGNLRSIMREILLLRGVKEECVDAAVTYHMFFFQMRIITFAQMIEDRSLTDYVTKECIPYFVFLILTRVDGSQPIFHLIADLERFRGPRLQRKKARIVPLDQRGLEGRVNGHLSTREREALEAQCAAT